MEEFFLLTPQGRFVYAYVIYDTPLLGTRLCGGLYPASAAFFIASTDSSAVTNGVILTTLTAPPAEKAKETAIALTLSGIFAISTTSYSPKENQPPCKRRVNVDKTLTAGTLQNYFHIIKLFCEQTIGLLWLKRYYQTILRAE
jgi:hypothetical protein